MVADGLRKNIRIQRTTKLVMFTIFFFLCGILGAELNAAWNLKVGISVNRVPGEAFQIRLRKRPS